ncbi:MAG: nucleotidyltransferase domain-containing protein [Candidatus Woesearchaeota archaeon]
MTPKPKKQKAGIDKAKDDQFAHLGLKLPKDVQIKLKDLKGKLDKFQEGILRKFDKYIVGITLVPPQKQYTPGMAAQSPTMMPQQGMTIPSPKVDVDTTNILVLVDDSDSKRMAKFELKAKLSVIMQNMAAEIDKKIVVDTVILSELWQNCFDAKYEALSTIALSAPLYDTGMLAAIRIAEIHKTMVLKKFEKYIVSYVLAGSLVQGRATKTSDVDVWIVIDDTDVKRMTRAELKDKLRAIIIGMGIEAGELTGIKNKLNIQVYILTDFWDNLKEANPIIFTLLRDGVPFYDRGMFMPWKQLLRMGKIKPSPEAIDMFMLTGEQMLQNVRFKLKSLGMEDTYYAILTPSQAALMLYGLPPPAPSETAELVRTTFVKKEKLLEDEYVDILEKNIKFRKEIEHGNKKDVTGEEIDTLLSDADKYLKRIKELFKQIQSIKSDESVVKFYETTVSIIRDILRLEGVEQAKDDKIIQVFEDELVSQGKVPTKYLRILNTIVKAKKDYDAGKLTNTEVDKVAKESNELIRFMVEYMQRKRGKELERTKIRVKYGNEYGEVILLDDTAYIIHDIDKAEKRVTKAKINQEGSLGQVNESSLEELEKAMSKIEIPSKVFIKEPIFENLKEIFGKDVEILVNY